MAFGTSSTWCRLSTVTSSSSSRVNTWKTKWCTRRLLRRPFLRNGNSKLSTSTTTSGLSGSISGAGPPLVSSKTLSSTTTKTAMNSSVPALPSSSIGSPLSKSMLSAGCFLVPRSSSSYPSISSLSAAFAGAAASVAAVVRKLKRCRWGRYQLQGGKFPKKLSDLLLKPNKFHLLFHSLTSNF